MMMEEMKAMDARLDGLVQKMDTAQGEAKVDATAAAVSELVQQRKISYFPFAGSGSPHFSIDLP
jgi:hypothetical protein